MNLSLVGIDYSITSPAICVITGNEVKFRFFQKKDLQVGVAFNGWKFEFNGKAPEKKPINQQVRYAEKADWIVGAVPNHARCAIENYAYRAVGRVNHISEATELCKWFLWERRQMICTEISPPEIKKFATGSGNANKDQMADAFYKKNGFWVHELLQCKNKADSPASDCVDAYYIALMAGIDENE